MSYLDEIKKRVKESSENWFAEWNWDIDMDVYSDFSNYVAWGEGPSIRGENFESVVDQAKKDKEFIAHAKDDIIFLLGEIELLREKVEELEEKLKEEQEEHWDY